MLLLSLLMLSPVNLRCEYMVDPIGIDEAAPRLSWVDESTRNGERQTAYRLLVASNPGLLSQGKADLWDSGKVASSETAHVVYQGRALDHGQRAWWTVSVWDAEGKESREARPSFWETGLLSNTSWEARWIGIPNPTNPDEPRPAPFVRHEFVVKGPVESARAYVTARGLYHAWIDSHKLGDGRLTPDWTDYDKRVLYQTYDVTGLLKPGRNAVGLALGQGWYCGHVGLTGGNNYGDRPLGLVQIEIRYRDGSTERVVTDGSWKGTTGPVLSDDLLMGESYDARKELGDWTKPGYDDSAWKAVDEEPLDSRVLQGQFSPLVTKLEEIHPQKITEPEPGTYVFDLGQNMVGWVRLKVNGEPGEKIQLRFAEMLQADGNIYTTNLRGAKATDTYTCKGGGTEIYEPWFTFHGFRYVEVKHCPEAPALDAVTGIVVGSDVPRTGTFECSNKMVDQLQHNIFWGQRGNYVSIPTDCPQRDERLGWMGDAQIFARTACFNNDVSGFLTKWTQDVVDAQGPEGGFPDVAPRKGDNSDGAPAWGDAGVIVPWTLYLCYGDKRILERHYGSMRKWVEYIDSVNPDHLWIERRNNNFGDWLNVHDETPKEVLSTAYFAYSTELLAKSAEILDKTEDAAHYRQLHSEIKNAFVKNFIDSDGKIMGDTQTGYVVALHFGLVPDSLREACKKRLVDHILIDRKGHLSTGFVGVGYICPTLTSIGRSDVAYKLLLNDTYPSWGYEIRHGATTIWERWDGWTEDKGFQDPGMNSFNHYAFGSIGEWMYRTVAGIDLDEETPGYEKIVIRPIPGGGLTWAKGSLDSIRGKISSSWRLDRGAFELDVTIPANTTATVYVPGTEATVDDTAHARSTGSGVFEVPGGHYVFRSKVR